MTTVTAGERKHGPRKWAGEVLLREAHDLCGLPVAVFRSDMILAHSQYAGQLNVPDAFTRLMFSLLTTGIAPASFYQTDPQGGRAVAQTLPDKQRQYSVLPLLDAYRKPETPLRGAPAPTEVFRGAVRAAKLGAGEDIPHLSSALIDKYVADLRLLGLV